MRITAPGYSTIAGAVLGLVMWTLQNYVFHGAVPEEVQGALWIIVPAAVTGVSSLLTKRLAIPPAAPGKETGHAVTQPSEVAGSG